MLKYLVAVAVCLAAVMCCSVGASALEKEFYAPTSKLASGKWVKIAVTKSGIYQITVDDIRSWGLGTDLSQIHVFGYGGKPLSEVMQGDNYADDLPQMPVVRTDGRILFYAQGPTTWNYENDVIPHLHRLHPYSNWGAYFVTNDSRFTDVDIKRATNQPGGTVETTYIERTYHDVDLVNPGETGRVYLGEDFKSNPKQTFKFELDGLVAGSTVRSHVEFAALTTGVSSSIKLTVNDQVVADGNSIPRGGSHSHFKLSSTTQRFTLDGTSTVNYGIEYTSVSSVNLARLNFITINYERPMALKDGSLQFGIHNASPSKSYRLTNCGSATHVWNVTKPFDLIELNTTSAEGAVTFSPSYNGRQEFVAFDESGRYDDPEFVAAVSNQDIHGEPVPDMIILAPNAYLEQAQRVAALHEQYDNFRVLVLDHEKVFNEFSSGTRDAMAYRRLCKMFYDRGESEDGHRLGYLLLMGNGSYNNRMVGRDTTALNYPHLLTWQSPESDDDEGSITTDDYFGMLFDGEGIGDEEKMSISVGRIIAKSVSEARTMVNKLVKYVTTPIYGSWKNQVLMVADDEDIEHMEQSERMVAVARANGGKDLVYNHVYIDAFNAVSVGGSNTYPDARTKMYTALREGVMWWNYIGHASTQNWTGEGLMMRSDVETQLFYRHLPVLYAATCEYTRFDNTVLSSGERLLLNANGGVVASICPSRMAYIGPNGTLSANVANYAFSPDESGRPRRIGDILRLAKNGIKNVVLDNNRRFFVFGDPAMRLAYSPYKVQVETINDKPVDPDHMPVFKAREQVKFSGKIVDMNGNAVDNFNGSVISTLFGPEQSVTTHGCKFTYQDRPNRLAINVDTVVEGRFNVRVIIPSEVNNEYDNYEPSLINLYASDSRQGLEAKGSNSDFYIYGYEDDEVADTIGPDIITMGLNDDNFVNGSDVNESPLLLATVADESGVNFSSAGIGHSMTLTLDGTTSFNDLVSYYTPLFAEQGTLGTISYQLSDLSAGPHTLRLRVWDVYNNVNERTITFNVVNGLAPEIADVYCVANPASIETSFYIKHNRPDAVMTVTIEVYDLMGRMVWSTTQAGRSDMYTTTPVTWDLIDFSGRRVPRGIYVYRATITTDGIKEATKAKKLAVTGE